MEENRLEQQNAAVTEAEAEAETTEEQLSELLQIRRDKLTALKNEGNDPFEITVYDRDTYAADVAEHFEEMEGKTVSLAGRMMSCRNMGKACFADLRDMSGRIQIYVRINDVGSGYGIPHPPR